MLNGLPLHFVTINHDPQRMSPIDFGNPLDLSSVANKRVKMFTCTLK